MQTSKYWIEKLKLTPHPEGGYYRQTYMSDLVIAREALPARFAGARSASTAIYFLLEGEDFSAFHRLRSDELWHFYAGSPLAVHRIEPDGLHSRISLGVDLDGGQTPQALVKAGCWFASHLADWKSWALVGCTVAPGFEFKDFELGNREELVREYPEQRELITRLTRGTG
jgi:uncharacterized protein